MLCKLAWGNVRRAGRDYLVYLITLALGITVFYAFNTISEQATSAGIGKELGDTIAGIVSGLTIFLAAVMGFLMVYANNFIMKRRKQQFGLYQVLGMGRGQVALIMTLETAIVSLGALAIGLACGIGLSQLMTFFTASLRRSLLAQQAVFFAFPLVVALAHSAVALHVIIDVVETVGALTIGGTVGLTCAIFVAAYGGYFLLTYAMGAGMVRESVRSR